MAEFHAQAAPAPVVAAAVASTSDKPGDPTPETSDNQPGPSTSSTTGPSTSSTTTQLTARRSACRVMQPSNLVAPPVPPLPSQHPGVEPLALQQLVHMGFSQDHAAEALVACGNNLTLAMDWILTHQPSTTAGAEVSGILFKQTFFPLQSCVCGERITFAKSQVKRINVDYSVIIMSRFEPRSLLPKLCG